MRDFLKTSRRVVIKAGTSILTSKSGFFSAACLNRLGNEITGLVKKKREVVLVSSGAIAFGMEARGVQKRPKEMAMLQACAAIGQGKLMHAYEQFFFKRGLHTAQLLLTRDALEVRNRFLRARQTFESLLGMKDASGEMQVLPIVNENDTVATEEIAFGDNDILGVQVSHLIHADLLIILSDVDGFYLKDKTRVRQVSSVKEIDMELVKHLKDRAKEKNVGGMKAKLQAAKVAMNLGIPLLMVNGRDESVITRALAGEDVGTLFRATGKNKNSRKDWIAFSAARSGTVTVDDGAFDALRNKKRSLLPRGMVKVRGDFKRGDVVELETSDGKSFGRGMVRFSSRELAQLIGKKTDEIQSVLGYKSQGEIIHCDDLVIWD